jgi:hypothetical protein
MKEVVWLAKVGANEKKNVAGARHKGINGYD